MRLILDTNILLSALLSPLGAPAKLLDAWERKTFTLVACDALIASIVGDGFMTRALAVARWPRPCRLAPRATSVEKRGPWLRVRGPAVSLEFSAQLRIVVDFAVEHDDETAVAARSSVGKPRSERSMIESLRCPRPQ